MKKRRLGIAAVAALAVAALGAPVAADATRNEHNCIGAVVSDEAPTQGPGPLPDVLFNPRQPPLGPDDPSGRDDPGAVAQAVAEARSIFCDGKVSPQID